MHRSSAYWHFAQGHLLETFVLLSTRELYRPDVQLSFGDPQFFDSWRKFLPFYLAIVDQTPRLDRGCDRARRAGGRILHFPEFGMGPSSRGAYRAFFYAANTSLLRSCRWLPRLHSLALARRGARRLGTRPPRITMLQRPNGSASGGPGRRILNMDEVVQQVSDLARKYGAHLFHGNMDHMAPMEQVDLLLETDVLLSYHGSGVGAGHFWMAPGTIVVEFEPPGVQYCIFAACGAESGKAWIESSDARTPQMEVWKPGGWNGQLYICNPTHALNQCDRTVDARPVLRILNRALASLGREPQTAQPTPRHRRRHSSGRLGRNRPSGALAAGHGSTSHAANATHAAASATLSGSSGADYRNMYAHRLLRATDGFARSTCGRYVTHGCARACGNRVLQVWEGNHSCTTPPRSRQPCSIGF